MTLSTSGKKRSNLRLWSWIGAAVLGVSAFLYGSVASGAPQTNAERAHALANDFACPVCHGQSVAQSDASVARIIRREIRTWVDEGRTTAYIRSQLVADFGEDIDYTPSATGITSLVWILPVVGGAGAVTGLFFVFRRWKLESDLEASAEDIALVEAARADLP